MSKNVRMVLQELGSVGTMLSAPVPLDVPGGGEPLTPSTTSRPQNGQATHVSADTLETAHMHHDAIKNLRRSRPCRQSFSLVIWKTYVQLL